MKTMDLFTPKVKEKSLHPLFKRLITDEKNKSVLDARKKESNKFIQQFQISFHGSFWELYLNKAFLDMGFKIDYSKESPDFNLIHSSGRVLNIEAVTCNNQQNEDKNYYTLESQQSLFENKNSNFDSESIIKLLGNIKDKKDIFLGEGKAKNKENPYSTLAHVKGKPFVIAVAPFNNHVSFAQNNTLINKVLFGVEPPVLNKDNKYISPKITHIFKKNGIELALGIFTNDSYKEISAVIFSTTGTFSKAVVQSNQQNVMVRSTRHRIEDLNNFIAKNGVEKLGITEVKLSETYKIISTRTPHQDIVWGSDVHFCSLSEHQETHLDGLHIYYNPYADIPLDEDLFNAYEITQNYFDKLTREMIPVHNDASLVSRQTFTMV